MKAADIQSLLGGLVIGAGVLIVFAAPLLLGYQCILWLQNGYWTPIAFREAISIFGGTSPIPDPAISWQGLQKVVVWLLDAPLSFALWVFGSGFTAVGIHIQQSGHEN
jgi:hypothetical protein